MLYLELLSLNTCQNRIVQNENNKEKNSKDVFSNVLASLQQYTVFVKSYQDVNSYHFSIDKFFKRK